MPKEFNFTPRLKLLLDHLRAVRELDKYVNGGGLGKDIQGLANELRLELNRHLLVPAGWDEIVYQKGYMYSQPPNKWRVVRGDNIKLEIYLARPVGDDDDPFVNLYVPEGWKKRKPFISKLQPPQGFQHVGQHAAGEFAESTSIFRYVRYEDCFGTDAVFDGGRFMSAIQNAAESLVKLETEIDVIRERLG
jgi:hypothetical protein